MDVFKYIATRTIYRELMKLGPNVLTFIVRGRGEFLTIKHWHPKYNHDTDVITPIITLKIKNLNVIINIHTSVQYQRMNTIIFFIKVSDTT